MSREKALRILRMCVPCLAMFAVGVGAGLVSDRVWHSSGTLERASRLSDLLNIAERLRMKAETQGKYPQALGDVIDELEFQGRVCESQLGYPAAGTPYDEAAADLIIVYELAPRPYGFVSGRFELRQGYWNFRLENTR